MFLSQPVKRLSMTSVITLMRPAVRTVWRADNAHLMKLLLIEDNPSMQTTLARTFERRGMRVQVCGDGLKALDMWQSLQPDAVVLDLSLPGRDGLQILADARAAGLKTPVIILTARGTVGDRIIGLNTGADDYLPKPFDLDELEARLRALVRRSGASDPPPSGRSADWCGLQVDHESGAVYFRGQALEMPPRELALLRAVLARAGQAISKERLTALVFPGESQIQPEAIEVVAYRLRRRIAHTGTELVTLRGLGYLIRATS